MTKPRFTPESYNARVIDWMGGEAGYDTFPLRTPEEIATRFISDNERTAMLLLHQAPARHAAIAEWAERLATDTTFTANAPEVEYDPEEFANPQRARRIDQVIIDLGHALVYHRLCGEEGHDMGLPLRGGAFPPLSKAIARYTKGLGNFYASELQRLRLGL